MPQPVLGNTAAVSKVSSNSNTFVFELNMAPKDPSRSGTKKDRMNRLAEMEELGTATSDNSVFVKAAGAFVAFIVIAIAAAASSGLLTQY